VASALSHNGAEHANEYVWVTTSPTGFFAVWWL